MKKNIMEFRGSAGWTLSFVTEITIEVMDLK